jgi:CheY-like chemotaxis protein
MKRKEPKFKYGTVMLLDDNELDNFINSKIIEAAYFAEKIYVNTNGRSALEFLKNLSVVADDCKLHPELIFVDLNMPIMDGFQFVESFIESSIGKRDLPKIAILTSSVCDEDQKRAQEISKDIVFLHKPLTEAILARL